MKKLLFHNYLSRFQLSILFIMNYDILSLNRLNYQHFNFSHKPTIRKKKRKSFFQIQKYKYKKGQETRDCLNLSIKLCFFFFSIQSCLCIIRFPFLDIDTWHNFKTLIYVSLSLFVRRNVLCNVMMQKS